MVEMSVDVAKKRGRPKKIPELDGSLASGLSPNKLPTPKKSTKQPPSTIAASKKCVGSTNKDTAKAIKTSTLRTELKAKVATIIPPTSPKTSSKREPNSPPPETLKTIARQESSKILQKIAALKVEEELKKAAGLATTPPPTLPTPPEPTAVSKPPLPTESPLIPSSQSSTMPSTFSPPSTYYQWLPNPSILAQQTAFRTLSTTSRLHQAPQTPESNAARKARALNRLATEASIPKAKDGLNSGGFPVTYKSATRRITAIIVAAPIALCMSWFLYERLVLGVEQKKLVPDAPSTSMTTSGVSTP